MLTHAATLCALAILLAGCGNAGEPRASSDSEAPRVEGVEQSSDSPRVFYTTNPGCTIDGVPGANVGTEQILRSKVISEACFAKPKDALN
jgi:hypothetical protein